MLLAGSARQSGATLKTTCRLRVTELRSRETPQAIAEQQKSRRSRGNAPASSAGWLKAKDVGCAGDQVQAACQAVRQRTIWHFE
jgi:hypothetical protein